jgi:hypothetical protein
METSDFTIQPCQSKFTVWKHKANKNCGEFSRFFQTSWIPNKFGPNSKVILLPGFFVRVLIQI